MTQRSDPFGRGRRHKYLTPIAGPKGGILNLDNFRRREWHPAVEASGVTLPARIYDLRSTFASDALAAGVGIHALARVMGTSTTMIERHNGTLLDGAMESIAGRLDALDTERDRAITGRHLN
jgi:integrase